MRTINVNRTIQDLKGSMCLDRTSAIICSSEVGTPVIYVSEGFYNHTGFRLEDVVGKSLSLLQGPNTEPESVKEFRRLIAERRPGGVEITNYKKDGTEFVHRVEMRPIFDGSGSIALFVAIQSRLSG